MDSDKLIKKQTLSSGTKVIDFKPGTKVKFHFRTIQERDGTVLDDSRKADAPMTLVLGKKFKLLVWEVIVQQMALNEVAKFTVDKSLLDTYPIVSASLREIYRNQIPKHYCGMTLQSGVGYCDLDKWMANPCNLIFIIELIEVLLPEDYEKDCWQMTENERLIAIQDLREKGNEHFKEKRTNEAEKCYGTAISQLEHLMLREKPQSEEWLKLSEMKLPLLLNYVQCRLQEGDYYAAIEHCNEVLKLDPNNVKALFRRARAHAGAWNLEDARSDYKAAVERDNNLKAIVAKELRILNEKEQQRLRQERDKYKKIF